MTGPPDKPKYQWDLVDFIDARNEGNLPEDMEEVVDEYVKTTVPVSDYTTIPDRVVSLDKKNYTRHEAYNRFAEIAERQGLMQVKHGETARYYYWECLYCKSEGES